MSVSLSVCLSVRLSARMSQQPVVLISQKHVTCECGLRPPLVVTMRCVMYFPFCGWMDGWNRPESKIIHVFRPVRQMVAPVGRQTVLFGRGR